MKQLQKSDLKEGEIYKQLEFDYIFLYNKNETYNSFNDGTAISTYAPRYCKRWSGNGFEKPMIEATPEEKHWLKVCIEADKFVSYEEAMKTFVPEYIQCVARWNDFTIGKIYTFPRPVDDKNNIRSVIVTWEDWKNIFKPSTKEAYDAQFKEPEFVLPKTWHIKINSEEESVIYKKFFKKVKPEQNWKFWINFVYGFDGINYNNYYFNSKLITFEQFKQYILKENTTITEKPKVVFEESKDKVLQLNQIRGKGTTIVQVQCSEGGVYKIGDKITVFNKISPNKGKPFTIKSFRWSNDKSKICAVTELHTPNGIGLDKIELHVESKKELSLLEQAELKYPSGTKFKGFNAVTNQIASIIGLSNGIFKFGNNGYHMNCIMAQQGFCYTPEAGWAEIVEDFVLPEKWCVRFNKEPKFIEWCNENTKTFFKNFECLSVTNSNYFHYPLNTIQVTSKDPNYTEITFEQFKKHVLKNE